MQLLKVMLNIMKDIIAAEITNEKNMEIIKFREKYSEMQLINRCQ